MRSCRARPKTPCERIVHPSSHGLGIPLSKVGFPIRKSTDQSFFAAPRGLSQRSTSFIASQRQGIHRMPLRHLIALILDTHPEMTPERGSLEKDQLAFKIDPKACGQARQQGVSHRLRLAPETMFRIDLLFTMS